MENRRLSNLLTVVSVGVLFVFLWWANNNLDQFALRIMRTGAVYIVAAVAYNLVNGITGQFSLGPNGFMAIGGYAMALLMLPLEQKKFVWFLEPQMWPFNSFSLPGELFVVALIVGGLLGALGALIVGIPSFRLRGDYLAIATFGFGEIIFVLANNLIPFTNGPLGIKGIPEYADIYWCFGSAVVATLFVKNLVNSSYGRAMKGIREDEIAAEAMGVSIFRTKMQAFLVSGFFAAVAGGLLGALVTTVSPSLFTFMMTFNLLIIIVLGGLGSITGSVITAFGFAVAMELLRVMEAPINIGPIHLPGIAGMRMVIFSVLLIVLMIFWRRGLFGQWDFSWNWLLSKIGITSKAAEAISPVEQNGVPRPTATSVRAEAQEGGVLMSLQNLTIRFGGLVAVSDFSLDIKKGEIVGLIGPNGAGKTTIFNIITGQYTPDSGHVFFDGSDITGWRPDLIARAGIARTFQNIRLFGELSVLDNVLVSEHLGIKSSLLTAALGLPRYLSEEREARSRAMALLKLVGLADLYDVQAGALPYGQQRQLEIARALATHPKLLLLDEPAAGMNPEETKRLMTFIRELRDRFSLTIFLIEHHMEVVMGICERIRVLDYGVSIAEGTPKEIQTNPRVIAAYLGEEEV